MTKKIRMVVRHPPPSFLAPQAAISALNHFGIEKYLFELINIRDG